MVPESPRYYISKGKYEKAEKMLKMAQSRLEKAENELLLINKDNDDF